MFIIEYYEAASQEWYQYGDEKFRTYQDANVALAALRFRDPLSTNKQLRISSIHEHNGFCGSLSD